jgi:hypothetical protein
MGASPSTSSTEPTDSLLNSFLCFANDDDLDTKRLQGDGFLGCGSRIIKPQNARTASPHYDAKELNGRSRKEIPYFLNALYERAGSKEISRSSTDGSFSYRTESRTPVWEKDPEPLKDWTVEEQKVLMSELKKNPEARKCPAQLQRVFERSLRMLPNKSFEEVQGCYAHLKISSIAYYGAQSGRISRNMKTQHALTHRPRS